MFSKLRLGSLGVLVPLLTLLAPPLTASAQTPTPAPAGAAAPTVIAEVHHDTSAPLTVLPPAARVPTAAHPPGMLPRPISAPAPVVAAGAAIAARLQAGAGAMPPTGANFDGIGNGVAGYTVTSAPPDPTLAVGPNNVVAVVNSDFAVYNKAGARLYGPVALNTLWSGFGGLCQTDNDGDPSALYDKVADRFVISQFAVTGANGGATPFLQCVAVSTTGDPTGAYNRYAFPYTGFPDYPKLATWADGYYATFNMFNAAGTAFLGAKACAYARSAMLAGTAATQQCFDTGVNYGGLLAADVDGSRQPPAGSPEYLLGLGASANQLAFWKFHVDWSTPASSTLTGPTTLATAAYSDLCAGIPCIPQTGTTQKLDALSDRLMTRLAYRNFGDHESLVANHTVAGGSGTGIRWYELRSPATSPTIFQQGTYAPDSNYRWMGSIAMDQAGNIGLGFSVSGTSIHPEIHYTGRLASDGSGLMTQGEGTIINGGGSQATGLSRWGDYSTLVVDPSDDCTFWYTNEYIPSAGTFNWATRIASFKFPSCAAAGASSTDFSIAANPPTVDLSAGKTGAVTIQTTQVGLAGNVTLAASGAPAGVSATISTASVAAGSPATLTLTVGSPVAFGTYPITITGTEGSVVHSTVVQLTVSAQGPDFSLQIAPAAITIEVGASGSVNVATAVVAGSAQTVTLSATVPTGLTASLPSSVPAGATAILTISATGATLGTQRVTVTGTAGAVTHSAPLDVTVGRTATITSADHTSFQVGTPGSFSVTAPGASSITESGTLPSGVGFTDAGTGSGVLAGTPASGTGGVYHLSFAAPSTIPVATNGIVNGGFEAGTLSGWTVAGTATVVSAGAHGGTYAAMVGATVTTNGDSTVSQTFTAPAGAQTISLWSQIHCPDTVTYDWAAATLRDNTSGTTSTVLAKTCSNSAAWSQSTAPLVPGHSYTVTLLSHDDNYSTDPTYTLFDDVSIVTGGPATQPITNPGFETGYLNGWSVAGTATVISAGAHGGTYAARVGSTFPTNGDSSLSQTFTTTGAGSLSIWYQSHCPDTVTYDWTTVTLKDTSTGVVTNVLGKVCDASGTWKTVSTPVAAGSTYTLQLVNHDDNYSGDPTYSLFDDIQLSGGAAFAPVVASSPSVQSFTLTVAEAPAITSASALDVAAGSPISFKVTTRGYPAAALQATGVPTGLTFTAGGDGSATLTGAVVGGSYPISITATNGVGLPATQTLIVTASNPAPVLTSIQPSAAASGSADLTLNLAGAFVPGSIAKWNGAPLASTVAGPTAMSAIIPARNLAAQTTALVTVTNPAPGGGSSAAQAFFVTTTGAAVPVSSAVTNSDPLASAAASVGGTGPGTPGSISAVASGAGTVVVGGYASNPGTAPAFNSAGAFIDVAIAPGSAFTSVTITDCTLNGGSLLYWWNGSVWTLASDQHFANGCVVVTVSATTSPSLAQLTGTPFASALPAGPTVTAVSPTSITYGDATGVLSASLSAAGQPVPGVVLQFSISGVAAGAASTDSTGTARLTFPANHYRAGVYNAAVAVNFAGTPADAASSGVGTLTVSPAALTITAIDASQVYGAARPTLGVNYSGFVNGEGAAALGTAPTVTVAGPAVHAGRYSIDVSGATAANYAIGFRSGTLTITPAPLTITANDQFMYYRGTLPALTVSYSGFVRGDTAASLTTRPVATTTATVSSPPSGNPYAISVSGGVDPDYTITYVSGKLTVVYKFGGFTSPRPSAVVDGQDALPVTFQLCDATGAPVRTAAATLLVDGVAATPAGRFNTGNSFRYFGLRHGEDEDDDRSRPTCGQGDGGYFYLLSMRGLGAGPHVLTAVINDGTRQQVTITVQRDDGNNQRGGQGGGD